MHIEIDLAELSIEGFSLAGVIKDEIVWSVKQEVRKLVRAELKAKEKALKKTVQDLVATLSPEEMTRMLRNI